MSRLIARSPRQRVSGALLALALVALLAGPAHAGGIPATGVEELGGVEQVLGQSVDAARAAAGLPALRSDVRLVDAARGWSAVMADRDLLVHSNGAVALPDEVTAWAENIGWSGAAAGAGAELAEEFLASAAHREAILDPSFTNVGIGVVQQDGATWVTEIFTREGPAAAPDPAPAPAPPTVPAPAPAPAGHVEGLAARAQELFADAAATHAVVVRDDAFPDALAAGPLAGAGGPLLLTPPGTGLDAAVRRALEGTVPQGATVYLVGGDAAVSPAAEAEVRAGGWVPRRVSGADRVETAAAVARVLAERDGPIATVLLATSGDWPDAVAGGAYGAASGAPVLLAHPDGVPAATQAVMDELAPRRVVALGGSRALGDGVVAATGAERVAGSTREATTIAVATELWGRTAATAGDRWIAAPATEGWQWALGAAPAAARTRAPVLLVGDVPGAVADHLGSLGYGGGVTGSLDVFGPVDPAAVAALRGALDGA